MKFKPAIISCLLISLAVFQTGMARHAQYDEEARLAEKLERERKKMDVKKERKNPARQMASGVKEATVESAAGCVSETIEESKEELPVIGTLEGARLASGTVLDKTLKGAVKVATLGYGELESYEVIDPEVDSGETTKVKIVAF